MAEGIQITHPTMRSVVALVTDQTRPYKTPLMCPICRVIHTHKSLHIQLNDAGQALVSEGVLASLRRSGAIDAPGGFRVTGSTKNPPALLISSRVTRAEQDYTNRAMTIHGGI